MATIRKIRSKWQVLIRKHNLKPTYKTFILKEDAVKWSRETEVKIEQGLYKDLTPARSTTLKEVLIQYRDTVSIHKKGYEIEKYKINKLSKYPISNNTIADLSALKLSEDMKEHDEYPISKASFYRSKKKDQEQNEVVKLEEVLF